MLGSIGDRNIPNKIKSSWGCQIALNIKPELDVCFHNFLTLWGNKYFFTITGYCPFLSTQFNSLVRVLGNPSVLFRLSPHPGSLTLESFFLLFCLTSHSLLSSWALPFLLRFTERYPSPFLTHIILIALSLSKLLFLLGRVTFLRRKRKKMQALEIWRGDLSLLYAVILDTSECWDLERFDLITQPVFFIESQKYVCNLLICSCLWYWVGGWIEPMASYSLDKWSVAEPHLQPSEKCTLDDKNISDTVAF